MNYSEMSDFDIDLAVFQAKFGPIGCDKDMWRVWKQGKFRPCESWADAGPIIQNNYLSIECDDMFDEPTPQSYWKAHNPRGNHYTDENPLRAAMIVFLMMMMQEPA